MTDMHVSPNQRLYAGAFLYGLVALTLVAIVASLVFLVDLGASSEQQRDLVVKQNRQVIGLSKLLTECTTPPEERHPPVQLGPRVDDCFLRTQRQAAAQVGEIGNLSTIAAACGAANPGNIPKTRECVDRAIEEFPPAPREEVP